jgi:hypothetical protein
MLRMRVRAQCARTAAGRVGVVYHDGEEDRARRFDHGEEPVPGRVVAKSNGGQFCSVGYASICFQSSST